MDGALVQPDYEIAAERLRYFIKENFVKIEAVQVPDNPNRDKSDKKWDAFHWLVTLEKYEDDFNRKIGRNAETLMTFYSMGKAHVQKFPNGKTIEDGRGNPIPAKPTADDVLSNLIMDAQSLEGSTGFEDWADNIGFDPDSRSAERTYNLIVEQTKKLRAFLGKDYRELIELSF